MDGNLALTYGGLNQHYRQNSYIKYKIYEIQKSTLLKIVLKLYKNYRKLLQPSLFILTLLDNKITSIKVLKYRIKK